jgi:hypothetical protein
MSDHRFTLKSILLVVSLAALSPSLVWASSAEQKGFAIAEEVDRRDTGWSDGRADLIMVLRNRRGSESVRRLRVRWLEVLEDGDKILILFDSPNDLKGTALLSYTHATTPDDQWLYMKAIKRVKRISSANKSGPFVGSEFAYEDLSGQEVEKYRYRWLRDEQLDGVQTMVIERFPIYEHSGYTRQVVWADAGVSPPVKIEYYDRKGALLKTLSVDGYRRYSDRFWRADHMQMVNHQTGKSTELDWSNYHFDTGLSDRDFNRNSLKSAR